MRASNVVPHPFSAYDCVVCGDRVEVIAPAGRHVTPEYRNFCAGIGIDDPNNTCSDCVIEAVKESAC